MPREETDLLIVLIVLVSLTACGQPKPYIVNGFAMGTLITQEVYRKVKWIGSGYDFLGAGQFYPGAWRGN